MALKYWESKVISQIDERFGYIYQTKYHDIMSQFYNVKYDGYLYERLRKVQYNIQRRRKEKKSQYNSYSVDKITQHCKDDCYDEIISSYDKIQTKVYEKDGKIYVESETVLVIVLPFDELVYGGDDLDRKLTINEVVENNRDKIELAIQKLRATNRQVFYENYDKIREYMIAQARATNKVGNKEDMRRLMRSKLITYMKHPAVQMKIQEKDLQRKIVNAIAKQHMRMKSNHSKPVHKKVKRRRI